MTKKFLAYKFFYTTHARLGDYRASQDHEAGAMLLGGIDMMTCSCIYLGSIDILEEQTEMTDYFDGEKAISVFMK